MEIVKAQMKFLSLWNNVQSKSKNILMEALEVKMHYVGDFLV